MKQHKYVPVLGAATVAVAILLLMILWSHSSPPSGIGQGPIDEQEEAARMPMYALREGKTAQPMESTISHRFGVPDEWFVAGAMGTMYTETVTGVNLRVGETSVYLGQSPPNGRYLPEYVVGRAYPGWDTSVLPDAVQILSATLVLELPASGGREVGFDILIYRGMWNPPIDVEDWIAPVGKAVGRWHLPAVQIDEQGTVQTGQDIALYAAEPARTVRVSLDASAIDVEGITRLELRHAAEGYSPITAGSISLGQSQVTLDVEYRQ